MPNSGCVILADALQTVLLMVQRGTAFHPEQDARWTREALSQAGIGYRAVCGSCGTETGWWRARCEAAVCAAYAVLHTAHPGIIYCQSCATTSSHSF